jgi:stress-induced morphogen
MTTEEIAQKLKAALPGAEVSVTDTTGTGDHFRAEVRAEQFRGKSTVEMHRMVYGALGKDVGGPIHALQLLTKAL